MAGWLPIAGGMGQGLDEVLARIMQQNALDQHQSQLNETSRRNVADEGLRGKQIGIEGDYKNASIASLNDERTSKAADRESKQKAADVAAQREQDRLNEEDQFIHTPSDDPNIKKQQDMIRLRRMSGDKGAFPYQVVTEPNGPPQRQPTDKMVRQEDGTYVWANPNKPTVPVPGVDKTDPNTGETTTSKLKGFTAPPSPIIYSPNGEVPKIVTRTAGGTGTATDITDKKTGQPLTPKMTGQEANRASMAGHVASGIDRAQDELDEAEQQGLLGPLAGRTYGEFLAQKLGTTGNAEADDLLGRLQLDLKNISTGFAAIHSQRGSVGNARGIEQQLNSTKMSHALINGGLESIKQWVNDYAGDRGTKPQQPQDNPNAPPPMQNGVERVRVIGPKGETGTIPKGGKLPEGWKLAQ